MLERHQILLPDWQAKHYKMVCKKYDVSFSEMIRMALCVDIMGATRATFPKYKFKIDEKQLKNIMRKGKLVGSAQLEEFHKFLSKLYFEVRKATEFWAHELKKTTKGAL